jgi:hypothetical protein
MYRIRDLKNGLYQVHSKRHNQAFEGTPKTLFEKAISLGIKPMELSKAVHDLKQHSFDYAEFGDNGIYMYSKKNGG